MDAIEAILSRRSIRRYTDKPVPEEIIRELLEAAMSAPSAVSYTHLTLPTILLV